MIIETHKEVVYVSGSLRTNQWSAIKTAAYLVYASYPHGVVLDFAGVSLLSRLGETTFSDAVRDIERQQLPFVLVHLPADVKTQLEEGRLHGYIAETLETKHIRQAIFSDAWWQRLWGIL
jgi:anti-anti-sigma regulatory factor